MLCKTTLGNKSTTSFFILSEHPRFARRRQNFRVFRYKHLKLIMCRLDAPLLKAAELQEFVLILSYVRS